MTDREIVHVRLQGGPFDGERQRNVKLNDLPSLIYVIRCWKCGTHWYDQAHPRAEVYRRDEERGEWLIYVWCDPARIKPAARETRELVPAGGGHDHDLEEA